MLVFKELQVELAEAKNQLELLGSDSCVQQAEQWVDFLSRANNYVETFVWYAKSPYKRELRTFLQSGCSFQKTAKKCGVSVTWLQRVVLQAALVLERRFAGVLKALRNGNIQAVEKEFRKATEDCLSPFECLVRRRYQPAMHDGMDIQSCSKELCFLRHLFEIEGEMLMLDRDKIEHLLYLLFDKNNRDLIISQYLHQFLGGYWGIDDTLSAVQQYDASKCPIIVFEEVEADGGSISL